MLMLLMTIIISVLLMLILCDFTGRYSVRFLARRVYTVGELSPAFQEQYGEVLSQCVIPCKRLINSCIIRNLGGTDNRPLIYAAGEIYIDEERCEYLSVRDFTAGLMYEQAHYEVGFYEYSGLISLIILGGYLPLIFLLYKITLPLAVYHHGLFVSFFFSSIKFFYQYPLFFFFIVLVGIIKMEYVLGASVVTFYANNGYDLEGLLGYLRYVESFVTPGVNQTFNISSNRKRCEALLAE